jgi:hypothetical protein
MINVAVVTALIAQIAYFPLKWQAEVREQGAESTFLSVGGSLNATEMTQMRRIAPVIPPLCNNVILCRRD